MPLLRLLITPALFVDPAGPQFVFCEICRHEGDKEFTVRLPTVSGRRNRTPGSDIGTKVTAVPAALDWFRGGGGTRQNPPRRAGAD